MYIAKIAGSRYVTSLENVQGQWYLRMKLDDVVEAEVPVTHMTKRALHANMGTLFSKVNVVINSFQHDLLHKEIVAQIKQLLTHDEGEASQDTTPQEHKEDPRVASLEAKIAELENSLSTINDRLDRLESLN